MRLRNILLSSLCAVALPAMASAADLPMRSAPPAFVPPPPVFTWTGFYIGGNAGYDFDHESRYRTFGNGAAVAPGVFVPVNRGISDGGFTGGGQIGYNYQIGGFGGGNAGYGGLGAVSVVLGLEADAAYTDIDKTANITSANVLGVTGTARLRSSLDYLGTVRGRVGLAFDRVMLYGTGGFAYGEVNNTANFFVPTGTLAYSGGSSRMATGYAYGGGIEYAVPTDSFLSSLNFFRSSAVTIKAEYLHYDLGTQGLSVTPTAGGAGSYTTRVKTDGNLARVGINYKF